MMDSQIDDDLISIIKHSSNKEAQYKGWQHLLSLTATDDGLTYIIQNKKYLHLFLSYFDDTELDDKTCKDIVFKCLINITNQINGINNLLSVKQSLIKDLIEKILESNSNNLTKYYCYILCNISAHLEPLQKIIHSFTSFKNKLKDIVYLFCSSDALVRENTSFLALLFANLTRICEGRNLVIQDSENNLLLKLLENLTNGSEVRRLGISIMFMNCCYETRIHKSLLEKADVLPILLLPLMGSEDYNEEEMDALPLDCQYLHSTKKREPSVNVRKILVKTLSLFCYTEFGWNFLKSKGVYYVARELHKWETDSQVLEAIENLVAYLLVDKYSETEIENNEVNQSLLDPPEINAIKDLPDFII